VTLPWGDPTLRTVAEQVRSAENRIIVAEKMASLAFAVKRTAYPTEALKTAWDKLLLSQAHGTLGPSTPAIHIKKNKLVFPQPVKSCRKVSRIKRALAPEGRLDGLIRGPLERQHLAAELYAEPAGIRSRALR
jgi:hypothetical protein